MTEIELLLDHISKRGDRYGCNGGIYDLLNWCGKLSIREVTLEEARTFWENPNAPSPAKKKNP